MSASVEGGGGRRGGALKCAEGGNGVSPEQVMTKGLRVNWINSYTADQKPRS